MIELKKQDASTTEQVFSIQDVEDLLLFCEKLDKANFELERMLVSERSPDSKLDLKPPLGQTPQVKRPSFFVEASEANSKEKLSQSEYGKKFSERVAEVEGTDSETEICPIEDYADTEIESS